MALAPRRALLSVPSSSPRASVDGPLPERVGAAQLVGDLAVDERRRPWPRPCRRSARRRRGARPPRARRSTPRSARRPGPDAPLASTHLDLDGRVAAGIEDLAALDVHDLAHRGDRSRVVAREPAAHGPPTDRQTGDRDGWQQGHRQGRRADAGRRGVRRRRRLADRVDARGDGRRDRRRDRPARRADHRRHRRGRVRAGARRRRPPRPSAASTSSSTAPPSRSASPPRRSSPTSPASCSGTT